MMVIYETRSQAEHETLESLRRFLLVSIFFTLLLYVRMSPNQYFFIIVFVMFILCSLDLIKNFIIQLSRTKLKPVTWRFNLQKQRIHHIHFPWILNFRTIKVFYTPQDNEYIEFTTSHTFYRIWKNHIDENKELFNELIQTLETISTKSPQSLSGLKMSIFIRKSILYFTIPLILIFISILYVFPESYRYLLSQNTLIITLLLSYVMSIWTISRILFTSRVRYFLHHK